MVGNAELIMIPGKVDIGLQMCFKIASFFRNGSNTSPIVIIYRRWWAFFNSEHDK